MLLRCDRTLSRTLRDHDLPHRIDLALKRLTAALEMLEHSAEGRVREATARSDLEEELAVMQDDRARLAAALDGSAAHVNALIAAGDQAALGLERAGEAIRAVLVTMAVGEAGAPEER